MKRLRVYIAGPISKGDLCHNVNQATDAFIRLAKAGLAPMAPQWSVYAKPCERIYWPHNEASVMCEATIEGNDRMTHEEWLGLDFAWVEVSDAVLRLPGESRGADAEVWYATGKQIPCFATIEEVLAWAEGQ